MIKLIAFDADDTLWENEALYQKGRHRFNALLANYGIEAPPVEQIDAIEIRNLPYYGYGAMSFVLSLIEAAIELTGGRIAAEDIRELLHLGKEMLGAKVVLYEHVQPVLAELSQSYPLMLITKGDLNHQQTKVARSGLAGYFAHVEVVHDKNPGIYAAIFERRGVPPAEVLMVGNSLKSDILPVLELGGAAVYIPNALTWSHEVVEPPPWAEGRYVQLAHIGLLPEAVAGLSSSPVPGGKVA